MHGFSHYAKKIWVSWSYGKHLSNFWPANLKFHNRNDIVTQYHPKRMHVVTLRLAKQHDFLPDYQIYLWFHRKGKHSWRFYKAKHFYSIILRLKIVCNFNMITSAIFINNSGSNDHKILGKLRGFRPDNWNIIFQVRIGMAHPWIFIFALNAFDSISRDSELPNWWSFFRLVLILHHDQKA